MNVSNGDGCFLKVESKIDRTGGKLRDYLNQWFLNI